MIEPRANVLDLAAGLAAVLAADPPTAGGRPATALTLLDFLAGERSLRMPAAAVVPGAEERRDPSGPETRATVLVVHGVDARNDAGGRRPGTRDPLAELVHGTRLLLEGRRPEGAGWGRLRRSGGRLLVWEDAVGRAYWQDDYEIERLDEIRRIR